MALIGRGMIAVAVSIALVTLSGAMAQAEPGHSGPHGSSGRKMLEQMREMHQSHKHGHDFKAMQEMTTEQGERLINLMRDIGLALPPMDSHRGHQLFMNKGCIVCHKVNGVGSDVGPSLNASDMPSPMNAFEFAARMWKGAAAMVVMQQEELGAIIELTGQDLADLIAFVHDEKMQKAVTADQIPKRWKKKLAQ
jgi:cytochrome c